LSSSAYANDVKVRRSGWPLCPRKLRYANRYLLAIVCRNPQSAVYTVNNDPSLAPGAEKRNERGFADRAKFGFVPRRQLILYKILKSSKLDNADWLRLSIVVRQETRSGSVDVPHRVNIARDELPEGRIISTRSFTNQRPRSPRKRTGMRLRYAQKPFIGYAHVPFHHTLLQLIMW